MCPTAAMKAAVVFVGMAGCTGLVDDPGATDGPRPTGTIIEVSGGPGGPITIEPQPRIMLRMTATQYQNTIEDLFGADLVPTTEKLPADLSGEDFRSIGATLVGTASRGVELYGVVAFEIASALWTDRPNQPLLLGCSPIAADDPCISEAIRSVGRRLWRRPLANEETARYAAIVTGAAAHTDASTVGVEEAVAIGMQYALAGLLQSPHFLYISQQGEAGESAPRYTSLDIASRLAYIVLDSTPDEELLAAGEEGQLTDPAGVEAQLRRLLGSPRGHELVVRFFIENWEMTELEGIQKDPDLFPEWSPSVAQAAGEEFRRTLLDLDGDPGATILDVFSPRPAFINDVLAPIYGVQDVGPNFEPVTLDEQRVGLLTSVAFLAANAKPNRTSPAERGLFILWRGLCESVPEPPPNANTDLPNDDPATADLSLRERLALHRADPSCAGCHEYFDGLGLALEGFDAIGRFRAEDNGVPVDPRGEFRDESFADHRDLAAFLRATPDAAVCMSTHFYRYATGSFDPHGEAAMIEAIASQYPDGGPRFEDLVVELLTSVGFRHYSEEAEQ